MMEDAQRAMAVRQTQAESQRRSIPGRKRGPAIAGRSSTPGRPAEKGIPSRGELSGTAAALAGALLGLVANLLSLWWS
jgi:hypothetical protein